MSDSSNRPVNSLLVVRLPLLLIYQRAPGGDAGLKVREERD